MSLLDDSILKFKSQIESDTSQLILNRTSSNTHFETELTSRQPIKRKNGGLITFDNKKQVSKAKSSKRLTLNSRQKSKSKANMITTAITERVDKASLKKELKESLVKLNLILDIVAYKQMPEEYQKYKHPEEYQYQMMKTSRSTLMKLLNQKLLFLHKKYCLN